MAETTPKLYLFPVPMGDTPAASVLPQVNIEIVRTVKYFIVENIRSARRFLKACDKSIDIDTLTFYGSQRAYPYRRSGGHACAHGAGPLHGHNQRGRVSYRGRPGADAVAIAQRRGLKVVPLVGPSSILLSLMGSGFNGQTFAFNGYLPIDSAKRAAKIKEMERRIRREDQTQIFIETPYRNNRMISWLASSLSPDLKLCVASDITGPKEQIVTLPLSKWKTRTYNYDKIPTIFLLYK